jgi:hypothetical protein
MSFIAKEIGISECSLRKIMKKDLCIKSYTVTMGAILCPAIKAMPAEKAKKLLAKITHPSVTNQLIFLLQ